METKKHTPEPWMVGGDMAMKHTHCTQIIGTIDGTNFIVASFNYNFLEPAIRNCVRAVSCVNALAGIENPSEYTQSVERMAEAANRVCLKARGRSGGSVYMVNKDDFLALRAAIDSLEVKGGGSNGK